jgi:DNA uptake protein ComE-like DNA-binding protein
MLAAALALSAAIAPWAQAQVGDQSAPPPASSGSAGTPAEQKSGDVIRIDPEHHPGSLTGTTAPGNETLQGSRLVDINTAKPEELESLPDVAPSRVQAIIANRPYKSKEELVELNILPRSEYDEIKDRLTVK